MYYVSNLQSNPKILEPGLAGAQAGDVTVSEEKKDAKLSFIS